MSLPRVVVLGVAGSALLYGCAAATQSASSHSGSGPDCSFRSATTCWTLAGRFPPPRAAKPDSASKRLQEPPAAVLASRADRLPPSR
jgi:hypothetical protein